MRLGLSSFTGQPCRSRIAYEFLPKADYSLNLESVAGNLRKRDVFIEIETPYLLMLKMDGKNVSLFRSGKIIVKSTKEKGVARKIAEHLVEKMA